MHLFDVSHQDLKLSLIFPLPDMTWCLNILRLFWSMNSQFPALVSLANVIHIRSIPTFRSFRKTLNRTGTRPWAISLSISPQDNLQILFWVGCSTGYYRLSFNRLVLKDIIKNLVKCFTNIMVQSLYNTSLNYHCHKKKEYWSDITWQLYTVV